MLSRLECNGQGLAGHHPRKKARAGSPPAHTGPSPAPGPAPATHSPSPHLRDLTAPRAGPEKAGVAGHGRYLLSIYPKSPPSSGKVESCLFGSLLRVPVGWGPGQRRESGCPTPSSPFAKAGDGSQIPNSRAKARLRGRWPKVLSPCLRCTSPCSHSHTHTHTHTLTHQAHSCHQEHHPKSVTQRPPVRASEAGAGTAVP